MTKGLTTTQGRAPAAGSGQVQDLVQDFIAFVDATDSTIRAYTAGLKQFIAFLASNEIARPERQDVIAFREAIKERGLKANTIQLYIVSVRRFFQWTEAQGLYPNIAKGIKGATVNNGFKKDYLTAEQLQLMFDRIDTSTEPGARNKAILALMATAGLRTIEVIRADIGSLDGDRLYIHGKGRDEADEYIKLSSHVQALMRAYLDTYRPGAADEEALFTSTSNNNQGARLTTRSISGIAKQAYRSIGIDSSRHTAHSLRHTAATLNLMNGGTIEETQNLLRHSNINTTMIYLHHINRASNQSEQRISNAIFA